MSDRLVSEEFGRLLKVLAHPERIRLIEEIAGNEHSVSELQAVLDAPQSRVSQHLAKLRSLRIVKERREGQLHYYRLRDPELAGWLLDGMRFVDDQGRADRLHEAIGQVRDRLTQDPDPADE